MSVCTAVRRGVRALFVERRIPWRIQRCLTREYLLSRAGRVLFKMVRWTEPVESMVGAGLETITLLDHANVDAYLITIKSFLHYAGVRPRITVITDGSLTTEDQRLLRHHLPGIRIAPSDRFDRYRHPDQVAHVCRRNVHCKKLFCVPLEDAADTLLFLDSDIIFRRPLDGELFDLDGLDLRYNQDHDHRVHDPLFHLADEFLDSHSPRERVHDLNSGLVMVRKRALDMSLVEEFIRFLDERNALHPVMEQDCFNILASMVRSRPLSVRYWVGCNPEHADKPSGGAMARHFVSGVRFTSLDYILDAMRFLLDRPRAAPPAY